MTITSNPGLLRLPLVHLAFLLFTTASADAQQSLAVRLDPQHLQPATRITAFNLQIRSAYVLSVTGLPLGWQIDINNDANWHTSIQAHYKVGAAALTLAQVAKLRFTLTLHHVDEFPFALNASLTTTDDFKAEHKRVLDSSEIQVTREPITHQETP